MVHILGESDEANGAAVWNGVGQNKQFRPTSLDGRAGDIVGVFQSSFLQHWCQSNSVLIIAPRASMNQAG